MVPRELPGKVSLLVLHVPLLWGSSHWEEWSVSTWTARAHPGSFFLGLADGTPLGSPLAESTAFGEVHVLGASSKLVCLSSELLRPPSGLVLSTRVLWQRLG